MTLRVTVPYLYISEDRTEKCSVSAHNCWKERPDACGYSYAWFAARSCDALTIVRFNNLSIKDASCVG